jgi:hypothetical protein
MPLEIKSFSLLREYPEGEGCSFKHPLSFGHLLQRRKKLTLRKILN